MTSDSRIIGHSVELTDYGDDDIPLGMKLGAYFLHSHEWRVAFLTRLTEVGYIGLIEASTHVYDQLNEPKAMRCEMIAQRLGIGGSGKLAIFNALTEFLDDFLTLPSLPARPFRQSLESRHLQLTDAWSSEHEREVAIVNRFADLLDGR